MEYLLTAIKGAIHLIFSADSELLSIASVSIRVSTTATILATLIGIPLGVFIGSTEFRGRRIVITVVNTLLSLPTIVVGLTVYAFFYRQGPFGSLGILFTPWAMIVGQTILATPIVTALVIAAVEGVDQRVEMTAKTLGATKIQALRRKILEAKEPIMLAVLTGFGRVFAEVGISMMVGGNIRHYTRNITTAIALQTQKGEFELGLALGIILLTVAFVIALVLSVLSMRRRRGAWVCLN